MDPGLGPLDRLDPATDWGLGPHWANLRCILTLNLDLVDYVDGDCMESIVADPHPLCAHAFPCEFDGRGKF
jgi:hypothetical protein